MMTLKRSFTAFKEWITELPNNIINFNGNNDETQNINPKYKVVQIQKLKPIKKPDNLYQVDYAPVENWMWTKCKHYSYNQKKCKEGKCTSLCYIENNQVNVVKRHQNSFYEAFLHAYNYHEDIILSPDDVWLCICFEFSKYINNNSEQMRNKFVSHEGKKAF